MGLHGLASVTIGVPDPVATSAYYTDFGLAPGEQGWLRTTDGGDQLRLVPRPFRQLVELVIRASDHDDLRRAAAALGRLGISSALAPGELVSTEPVVGTRVVMRVLPPLDQQAALAVGFMVSDYIGGQGVFMRCSSEHHNVLVLAAPVNFLHHTSWQVDDVDEVGRGATRMLEGRPERHVWGLGRHHAGSNFFWYLKDPAGNFSEYFADMDCGLDDQLWKPEVFDGHEGLYSWGPPPPPSFLHPDDLAELMIGSHAGA
jgi:catechol 2,3-dioxygenase-like lactoylglutathione lyase family enzyme